MEIWTDGIAMTKSLRRALAVPAFACKNWNKFGMSFGSFLLVLPNKTHWALLAV